MLNLFKKKQKAFHTLEGSKRLHHELKLLKKSMNTQNMPLYGIAKDLYQDEKGSNGCFVIKLKLSNFGTDTIPSKNLNEDLKKLKKMGGKDHIQLEISIPKDYPNNPPFIRVVYPRCKWYTGHVTAGGSICMELLTHSGSSRGWYKECDLETVLVAILAAFFDDTMTQVVTASGPGGISGSLRIDLDREWHKCSPCTHYSEQEAKSAFERSKKANGW